ncbi:MAG: histidinol dehydrogenase [Methanospirillaceae archaeon]|nr:histidinol dehydrogenase [Methanospirillaceae archaeon]
MLSPVTLESWLKRQRSVVDEVTGPVKRIIDTVRKGGDEALRDLTREFDKISPDSLAVSTREIQEAYEQVQKPVIEALVAAKSRISSFHALQKEKDLWLSSSDPGITLGVLSTPLSRIGMYVPGGRASYSSTVLMAAIPAKIAGVPEICCCTPPPIHPLTLVALDIAGVSEIYRVGGAQAIAAMAYGTGSINEVEKIVGPGNVYVTAAKMMVRDVVEIDFPAGPSEIAIVADSSARPDFIAADIIAQSEHDPKAASVLVTPDENLALQTSDAIRQMVSSRPRETIIREALSHSGYIITRDLDHAMEVANAIAPEHLEIQVTDPMAILLKSKNAGSIFIGPYAPVACGDYATGTNHILPTAGHAKIFSGLNVSHFCKRSTVQILTREGLDRIGDLVELLADAEGLHAHADSVRIRR